MSQRSCLKNTFDIITNLLLYEYQFIMVMACVEILEVDALGSGIRLQALKVFDDSFVYTFYPSFSLH